MISNKHIDRTQLTPAEREVAEFKQQGLTHKQIAEKLHISKHTVKTRFRSIRERTMSKEKHA